MAISSLDAITGTVQYGGDTEHPGQLRPKGSALGFGLPRVTAETRARIVDEITERGVNQFTLAACDQLQKENPELLQMAEGFASRHTDYLAIIQGFCLVYRTLALQSKLEHGSVH